MTHSSSLTSRFVRALLIEALRPAGKVHLDTQIVHPPEEVTVWEPARSANDYAPDPPENDSHSVEVGPMRASLDVMLRAADIRPQSHTFQLEPEIIPMWFEPSRGGKRPAGLIGRLAAHSAILSPFTVAPTAYDIREQIRVQLSFEAQRPRSRRKLGSWMLCPTISSEIVRDMGLRPVRNTRSIWQTAPLLGISLVDAEALPRTRAALLLRLTGCGEVLRTALHEVTELPPHAWEPPVVRSALEAAFKSNEAQADTPESRCLCATWQTFSRMNDPS